MEGIPPINNINAAASIYIESYISVVSFALILFSTIDLIIYKSKRHFSNKKIFYLMGVLSPIPILWSDIGQWRYFAYSSIFLLVSLLMSDKDNVKEVYA